MGKWLFILLTVSFYVSNNEEAISAIDSEIAQLQAMKRGYESRALRQEDLGAYLQFNNQAWLETRRHYQLAEENRMKAALVQKKINALEEKKKKLQKNSTFF